MKRVRAVLDNGVDCESAAVRFLNLGHGAMSRGKSVLTGLHLLHH